MTCFYIFLQLSEVQQKWIVTLVQLSGFKLQPKAASPIVINALQIGFSSRQICNKEFLLIRMA